MRRMRANATARLKVSLDITERERRAIVSPAAVIDLTSQAQADDSTPEPSRVVVPPTPEQKVDSPDSAPGTAGAPSASQAGAPSASQRTPRAAPRAGNRPVNGQQPAQAQDLINSHSINIVGNEDQTCDKKFQLNFNFAQEYAGSTHTPAPKSVAPKKGAKNQHRKR